MNARLGTKILNAVMNAYPILTTGKQAFNKKMLFTISNPYILEVIPENKMGELSKLNGKKLRTVCRILDDNNGYKILNKYYAELQSTQKEKGISKEEFLNLYKKAFPNGKVPSDSNTDAMGYLSTIPESIGSKFDAHGISKISVTDHLRQLNELLTKGIDKNRPFHTAPLVAPKYYGAAFGTAGSAYRNGSFILVADKSKLLTEDGIKHVIVNDAYYGIINELRHIFPSINFVRADNAAEYFSKIM